MRFVAVDEEGNYLPLPSVDEVPSFVKKGRQALGLSLRALAEQLGVKRQAVWNWEQGQTLPTLERLGQLVKMFGPAQDKPKPKKKKRSKPAKSKAGLARLEEAEEILGV